MTKLEEISSCGLQAWAAGTLRRTLAVLVLILVPAVEGLAQATSSANAIQIIQAALQASNYSEAVRLSRSELRRSPRDFKIRTLEGLALAGLGRDQEALKAYDTALGISPNFIPALEGAAELEYKLGDSHAVGRLTHILELRPNDPTSHAMLATLKYQQHDCAAAVEHFLKSTELISTRPTALAQYGECLIDVNRPADAVSVFRQILAQSPNDFRVRYVLAAAQMEAHQPKDTVETLQPLLQSAEGSPDALALASSAYESLGDTPKAAELLRRAIVSNPHEAKYYLDFAMLSFNHGSFQVGIDMVNAGLQQLPAAAPLYVARGVLYIQLAQFDKSEADFETATRLDPKEASAAVAQAMALTQMGNLDQALATVETQLRSHPREAFLYYMKAHILVQKGAAPGSPEFHEVIKAVTQATQLNPDFVLARDVLGDLYLESGQLDLAIRECRLALHTDPSDQNALYHLIQALRRSGTGSKSEMTQLLKRLKDLRQQSKAEEASTNKYRLYELTPNDQAAPPK